MRGWEKCEESRGERASFSPNSHEFGYGEESGDGEEDVLVFVFADDGAAAEVEFWVEEALGESGLGEGTGGFGAFLPVEQAAQSAGRDLAVEGVVEVFGLVDLAVVDVDGGEEELARVADVEAEGHRVDFLFAFAEFEDGE